MPVHAENELQRRLRRLIETIDIANVLTEPVDSSIRNLLEVSAASLDSDEASILVRDGDAGELRFRAAIGKLADRLDRYDRPGRQGHRRICRYVGPADGCI